MIRKDKLTHQRTGGSAATDICLAVTSLLFTFSVSLWAESNCAGDTAWLNPPAHLPVFDEPAPAPHVAQGSDCPFYRAAWQVFLYATQPVPRSDGKIVPRFLTQDFSTVEETLGPSFTRDFPNKQEGFSTFLSVAPSTVQPANDSPIGAGINQAGALTPVIDRNGNPLFFGIHINDTIKRFLINDIIKPGTAAGLDLKESIRQANPEIPFPTGSIELKSAWQVVSGTVHPDDYYVTEALLPHLKKTADGHIVADMTVAPRPAMVALIALHVVFTLKGHPEFIWSSFEHVTGGKPDTAPSAATNPPVAPDVPASPFDFVLYKANTTFTNSNKPADVAQSFDEASQSFTKGGAIVQTSVYREYPASKSLTTTPDEDVVAINQSMAQKVFLPANMQGSADKRNRYQLVGAVWMDDPSPQNFRSNVHIRNGTDANGMPQNPDTPGTMVAGEDRLSSTAIESFTQDVNVSPNCFICHDTTAVRNDLDQSVILKAKQTNVSHILSRYLLNAK